MLVDKLGLHHIAIYEDTIKAKKILLIAAVSFNGLAYILNFNHETNTLTKLKDPQLPSELTALHTSFWNVQFSKDPNGEFNYLALTVVDGTTQVYDLEFNVEEGSADPVLPILRLKGVATSKDNSFPTCLDLDPTQMKMVVGHENGNVYMFDLDRLKLIYEFQALGSNKKLSSETQSSFSAVRSLKFSPGGTLLAVARDSGYHGIITLYDVKFGEVIGSLNSATHSSVIGIGGFAHEKWCLALSFNEEGNLLASGGMGEKIKIWNIDTKECDAVITISKTDVSNETLEKESHLDTASCCSLSFINKGAIANEGTNDGLVVVGFDRAIRWFREAGGI
ncbi:unnamed protein product [Ambrosiozyma monospora]|uniref:Unnamed protein product n=1 Tax=Ambrosiozyma monospora TaxID=43982 RepID=A0ACB5SWK2_AMBMO|nr:unnamed protein product [Ambrosiozyma monospora]